jgi:glycosyltransferase involved in cell wall biosynthesis
VTKLAFFLQDLAGGGAERNMLTLAAAFADRGYSVDLVLVRAAGPYLSEVPSNVRVVCLGTRRTRRSILALARYLRRERPHALLSALVHVNVAAVLAARLSGTKTRVIVTERNQIELGAAQDMSATVGLAYRSVSLIYPWADEIVAVSHGVARSLAVYSGLDERRIRVIYNPVVRPTLKAKARAALSHPWFADGEPPVVLGVGRLVEQKGFANLLRSFVIVRRTRPARLIILGEGPEQASLQTLADTLGLSTDVDLPGFVDNPYPYMVRATVFVLSSAWEGLPSVLIEAMACGTAVVATRCPSGPDEILLGGKLGEMVPVGDAKALAAAILRTLDRPPSPGDLQTRADEFSLERAVHQYEDLALQAGHSPTMRAAV